MGVCSVRVIDVINRKRLFPGPDSEETAAVVQTVCQPLSPDHYRSQSGRAFIFDILAEDMGRDIARLFYSYEARDIGGRLESPR